ncbi:MAG: ThuA domain-containing protein [Planctomycetota bacterium]|nr:ThuA domain-containing protein [Planctomycetota bacterium]
MKRIWLSMLLVGAAAAAQQETGRDTIGGVPYVRGSDRDTTLEAMLQALQPQTVTWKDWYLLSPFPYAGHGKNDLATVLEPEQELTRMRANGSGPDLERTYVGKKETQAKWRRLGRMADRFIDLHVFPDPELSDYVVCYLYVTVEATADTTVDVTLGSDDGVRAWVNGKLVHEKDVPRGLNPYDDALKLRFEEGVNHVLFKISEGAGGWAFQIMTREKLGDRDDVLLHYYLDRDFPPSPERAHYRALSYPVPRGIVLEVGGIAFLEDGRPVVCTRRGDVFVIEGAYEEPPIDARFELFATGLHEPLGLNVRNDADGEAVYAVQRAELTRLVDDDEDPYADRYETFCDDWGVSGNYHEFAFGPEWDREGNAWVTLNVGFCGSLGKAVVPYRGWAVKITPDGELIPVCDGLRSPNGIAMWTDGSMFYVDNQGDYVATNRLSHLAPGSWHGHPASLRWRTDLEGPDDRPPRQPASVWFPYRKMGQSAADIALDDTGGAFGPFTGQFFVGDQTQASVMRVFLEQVEGHYQGACFPFLTGLDCGVNRVEFAPDGSLFVGETDRGWASAGRKTYGLQRIVYTGVEPFEILAMRARSDGFELELTQDVDRATAENPGSYRMTSYTYEYHAAYGASEDDTQDLNIVAATMIEPRRVRLVVEPLRANYVHELAAAGVRSSAGEPLLHARAYYTLINVPGRAPIEASAQGLPKVLFLTHSAGFEHGVVKRPRPHVFAHAEERLIESSRGVFEITATQDCSVITAEKLAEYDAVVFYTTGELPITDENRTALMEWIRRGGAFVGVHSATDTFYEYEPYMEMIGGTFDGHPWTKKVGVLVEDPRHGSVRHLGERFEIDDEIYQFRGFARHPVRVLLALDPDSVDVSKGKHDDYPIAWLRDWGEGRVFYTALGHKKEVWEDDRFLEHLEKGIRWAIHGPDYGAPAPEDAVVLYDGKSGAAWRHRDGKDWSWKRAKGAMEVRPGTGDLVTREEFGDYLLHVEFNVPEGGNSGVYLHGRYEIQVLDSHGRDELRTGDCGGIYAKKVPAVDANRPPGRWQAFDIRFRAPRFDDAGKKTENARISLWHNGLLVHDDFELDGFTPGGLAEDEVARGPVLLQDHGHLVRYRDVWLVPLD